MPSNKPPQNPKGSSDKKQRWLKTESTMLKAKDEVWTDGRTDDIVVVIMGQTGVGKSTFVKHLISGTNVKQNVIIGEDLESCTKNLEPFPIPIPRGGRLVIVDTPGFDDTYEDESEIVRRIAVWLASSYSRDMNFGVVIYLHDIQSGKDQRSFELFQALCGRSAAKAMVLVTTKWPEESRSENTTWEVAEGREKRLREKFWGSVVQDGARMERFGNTSKSAWKIVNQILDSKTHGQILQIQNELVELERILPDTEAGQNIRWTIKELKALSRGREYHARITEIFQRRETVASQIDHLMAPVWHRLKNLFFNKREWRTLAFRLGVSGTPTRILVFRP